MTKEAEAHAEEDAKKKDIVEARNAADSLIFTSEKSLKDAGDKVPADLKTETEDKIKALKDVLNSDSKEDIEAKTRELSDTLQKVGQAMGAGSQQPGAEQPKDADQAEEKPSEDKKSDEPVEGEVVE
jgi:molecular chaperone DnaK